MAETDEFRIGEGYDRHRLERDETLVIGTITIESERGAVGHSDGDVLVHAMVDALLGAGGLNDIGQHFPDDEPKWENASSTAFLEHTLEQLSRKNWQPVNIDTTVVLESVKLQPYRSAIRDNLIDILPDGTDVNVKFTTAESLGPVGRNEAVEARAVTLVKRDS